MKTKEKKIAITLQVSESTYKKILRRAQAEGRKVAGFVRFQLECLVEKDK